MPQFKMDVNSPILDSHKFVIQPHSAQNGLSSPLSRRNFAKGDIIFKVLIPFESFREPRRTML
ncbi:MAG: hypothetical protein EDM79_03900 [Chloroflexi bacterium]|nr:MAG: hypothetical protein EDM79_03900 [Chloroflexota bacterium]